MGAARAILLLLTVWLFAAAWSGDHPDEAVAADAIPSAPPKATSGLDLGPLVYHDDADRFETRFAAMGSNNSHRADWLMSLPMGITPGTYLAVHANGFTERVTIDVEFLHTLGHDPDVTPKPTYDVRLESSTLTLVRIASPASRLVIAEGPVFSQRY
jgi:hypothetical protein